MQFPIRKRGFFRSDKETKGLRGGILLPAIGKHRHIRFSVVSEEQVANRVVEG